MAAVDKKGSYAATTIHLYTLLNYSHVILSAGERALQQAMAEYQQFLLEQHQPTSRAA